MLTPLPMLTSRQGSLGDGFESKRGAYRGGSGDGLGSGGGSEGSALPFESFSPDAEGKGANSEEDEDSDDEEGSRRSVRFVGRACAKLLTSSSLYQKTSSGIKVMKLSPVIRQPISSSLPTSTPSSASKRSKKRWAPPPVAMTLTRLRICSSDTLLARADDSMSSLRNERQDPILAVSNLMKLSRPPGSWVGSERRLRKCD